MAGRFSVIHCSCVVVSYKKASSRAMNILRRMSESGSIPLVSYRLARQHPS